AHSVFQVSWSSNSSDPWPLPTGFDGHDWDLCWPRHLSASFRHDACTRVHEMKLKRAHGAERIRFNAPQWLGRQGREWTHGVRKRGVPPWLVQRVIRGTEMKTKFRTPANSARISDIKHKKREPY